MTIHYVKIKTLFNNALTLHIVKGDWQPLCVRATKKPHTFKLYVETNEHTFVSAASFNYKRAMELAEEFYNLLKKEN